MISETVETKSFYVCESCDFVIELDRIIVKRDGDEIHTQPALHCNCETHSVASDWKDKPDQWVEID